MPFVVELIISLLIVIGGLFLLVGSFGMIKLRDLLPRLHA
ncbi:monovalent cation/H(+) antiporter subunit G, partial [Thalassospira sp. UBA1131]